MKMKLLLSGCAIFLCAGFLASCATTTLTSVWKNESYTGPPVKKIAVVGLSQKPAVRNLFEDEFVRELKARGVDAVQTYTVLLSHQLGDRETATAKIKTLETDSVLATRLIGKKTEQTYAPTVYALPHYYYSWPGYYSFVVSGGQVVHEDEVVYLETNLYDMNTGQLIWSARTETWLGDAQQTLVRSFAKAMIDRLAADRVIAR